jgi:anti-anti-sigma factor
LPLRAAPEAVGRPVVAGVAAADGDPALVVSAGVLGADGSAVATVSRRVRAGESGPEVIVVVQGDLDLDTAPLAEASVLRALDDAEQVCLDLTAVSFFGAEGVRVVITARQHAAGLGRTLRLDGVDGITRRVLALTGLYPPDGVPGGSVIIS